MRRLIGFIGTCCLLTLAGQAMSQDLPSAQSSARRALADCMSKRMSVDKTLSYIAATTLCREQIKTTKTLAASGSPVKPVTDR